MKKLMYLLVLSIYACGSMFAMDFPEEYELEPGYVWVEVEHRRYKMPKALLENSATLKIMMEDMQKEGEGGAIPLPNISQKTWEDVVRPVLDKDAEVISKKPNGTIELLKEYDAQELVNIINAANYLDMPDLLNAAIDKAAEYIKKNMNLYAKDAKAFDIFKKVPGEILSQLTREIVDIKNYKAITKIKDLTNTQETAVFNRTGTILATSPGGIVYLWDMSKGPGKATLATTLSVSNTATAIAFNDDDVLAIGALAVVYLYDVSRGSNDIVLLAKLTDPSGARAGFFLALTRNTLASGDWNGNLYVGDTSNAKSNAIIHPLQLRQEPDTFMRLAFNPAGNLLVSGLHSGDINLWDISKGPANAVLVKTLGPSFFSRIEEGPHNVSVSSLAFSPDGNILATGLSGGKIHLWDLSRGPRNALLMSSIGEHAQFSNVFNLVFSLDNRSLIFGAKNRVGIISLLSSSKKMITLLENKEATINSMALNPAGDVMAIGFLDKVTELWHIPSLSFTYDQAVYVLSVLDNRKTAQLDDKKLNELKFSNEQKQVLHDLLDT